MTHTELIREFLRLPSVALPRVAMLDDDSEAWDHGWDLLRRRADGEPPMGLEARLSADRDEWRDGVVVTL